MFFFGLWGVVWMLQSLMIASIPNIIGWLAISFAKVSIIVCKWHDWFGFLISYCCYFCLCDQVFNLTWCFVGFIGLFLFVYGEVIGRFWCWNYFLCGKFDCFVRSFYLLSLFGRFLIADLMLSVYWFIFPLF